MEERWKLEMSMVGPFGERYDVAIELDRFTAGEFMRLKPPVPGLVNFDDAVDILKTREFRKQLFTKTATRLGTSLAERMEDKEGCQGVDRAEKLDRWGHP